MKKYDMLTVRNSYKDLIKKRVEEIGITNYPVLFVQPFGDPRAESYIKSKQDILKDVGLSSVTEITPEDATTEWMENIISDSNETYLPTLIQLPMNKGIEPNTYKKLSKYVDIDALGYEAKASTDIIPCTPTGISVIIKHYLGHDIGCTWDKKSLYGQTILVIGRGELVGAPLSEYLRHCGATVLCACNGTSRSVLEQLINVSDIVVSATGYHGVIDDTMIKPDKKLLIIDSGVSFIDGKLKGDFKYNLEDMENRLPNVMFTPHIGGVGPMTVLSVAYNVTELYKTLTKIKGDVM